MHSPGIVQHLGHDFNRFAVVCWFERILEHQHRGGVLEIEQVHGEV